MAEIYIIDSEWEVCSNCEHWHQDKGDALWGRCREGPGQGFIIDNEDIWLNPHKHAGDTCSRFARRIMGRTPIQVEGEADVMD